MINNFNIIYNSQLFTELETLNNMKKEVFLTIIIMKRKKDNPDMNISIAIIKQYVIENKNQLIDLEQKIIEYCNINNARAYISVNIRDTREVLLNMASKCIEKYKDKGSTPKLYNIFWEVAGQSGTVKGYKRWVIDIDNFEYSEYLNHPIFIIISNIINESNNLNHKFDIVPTKSGFHIITPPFDIMKFKNNIECYIGKNFEFLSEYKNPKDFIKKDNLTILYIP